MPSSLSSLEWAPMPPDWDPSQEVNPNANWYQLSRKQALRVDSYHEDVEGRCPGTQRARVCQASVARMTLCKV